MVYEIYRPRLQGAGEDKSMTFFSDISSLSIESYSSWMAAKIKYGRPRKAGAFDKEGSVDEPNVRGVASVRGLVGR